MKPHRQILFAGTTSSGSSALFDYFRCFPGVCGMASELPMVFRKTLYPQWKSENFQNVEKYSYSLRQGIQTEAEKRFGKGLTGSILLLNNVVTCLTLPGLDLLDNIKAFCVVRDPRSTWLRRKELCLKHGKEISVSQFIAEYRSQRKIFEDNLNRVHKNKKNIFIISFEDFLLDVDIKMQAINWAGFDIKNYPLNPQYVPYPKEKSILLHRFYKNQDEITLIKKQLREYCHEKV